MMRRPTICTGKTPQRQFRGGGRACTHQFNAVAGERDVRSAVSVLCLEHVCIRRSCVRRIRERLFALLSMRGATLCELRQRRLRLFAVHLLPLVAAAWARLVRGAAWLPSRVSGAPILVVKISQADLAAEVRERQGLTRQTAAGTRRIRVRTVAAAAACRASGARCWRRAPRPRRRRMRGSPRARTTRAPP